MSYTGERGVLWVENGSPFCTPVLKNMCNIRFQVLRLGTFVFEKFSKKVTGSGWNNVGPASQTVAQHYINIEQMCREYLVFLAPGCSSVTSLMQLSENTVQSPNAVKRTGQRRSMWVDIETALLECHVFAQSIQQTRWRIRAGHLWWIWIEKTFWFLWFT